MPKKCGSRGKTRQVSVTIPEDLIEKIDAESEERGMTRSAFTVLLYDLYFREQKLAEGVAQAASPAPLDPAFLEPVTSRLDALERKADRQIEVTKGAREAARGVPDLIRKDLARHVEALSDFVKNDAAKGAEGRRVIAEQVDDNGKELSEIRTRVDRISQAMRELLKGRTGA